MKARAGKKLLQKHGKGASHTFPRPEYHQKPISKQLVHLRVRIPDPGSIKRLHEGFDFSLMFV